MSESDKELWRQSWRWRREFGLRSPQKIDALNEAFKILTDAGCVEEGLYRRLMELRHAAGRSTTRRRELVTLAKRVTKLGKDIQRVWRSDAAVTLDLDISVGMSFPDGSTNYRLLHLVLDDFGKVLIKNARRIPTRRKVSENRAYARLEDYVRGKNTAHRLTMKEEKALNTLAAAVVGKQVSVRLRAHRHRKREKGTSSAM
jgi:hypothetical protein